MHFKNIFSIIPVNIKQFDNHEAINSINHELIVSVAIKNNIKSERVCLFLLQQTAFESTHSSPGGKGSALLCVYP